MDSLSRLMSEFLFGVGTYFFHYFLFQTHGTLLFLCSGHKNKLLVYKVFFAWMLGRTIISLNFLRVRRILRVDWACMTSGLRDRLTEAFRYQVRNKR